MQMLAKLEGPEFPALLPQRLAILKILASSENHPSVERIYEQVKKDFATTSLATIYKTVILLKQLHEVRELGFPDGSNQYDGSKPFPHRHVVCLRCKRILDPDLGSLAPLTAEAAHKTGFRILDHRLDFFGIRPECQGPEQPWL